MKIFQNKSIFKKLIIVFICILLLSICIPGTVKAENDGTLLNPIMTFFVSLGDGIMTLVQKVILHMDDSLVQINTSSGFWAKVIVIVTAAIAVSAIIAATVLTAGTAGLTIAGVAAALKGATTIIITIGTVAITFPVTTTVIEGMLPNSFELPLFEITPQEIFANKIPLLDVDFFNPSESITLEDGEELKSTATELKPTISSWYVILRDISIVALLSILVYVGIRILLSSTSKDKSKYKQMLIDWIVALCLLFVMQYIMSFSNLLVEKIVDIVDTTKISKDTETEITEPEVFIINDKKKVKKAYEVLVGDNSDNNPYYELFVDDNGSPAGEDSTVLVWPAENFMQQARLKLQLLEDDKETYIAIGWKLVYVVLVLFTLIFIFTYVKRVIYMTFLTIIAPLVALTYPIDKMNDGSAQAFNMWFKEYIFNLLIQPMHLILYTVLISSAMNFASQNIIYVIVALFFMIPAEKLLRKFFGFEKAQTPGLLQGPAAAALMMGGMNKLLNKSSHSKSSTSSKENDTSSNDNSHNLRFNDKFDKTQAMIEESKNSPDSDKLIDEGNEKEELEEEELEKEKEQREEEEKKRKRLERQMMLEDIRQGFDDKTQQSQESQKANDQQQESKEQIKQKDLSNKLDDKQDEALDKTKDKNKMINKAVNKNKNTNKAMSKKRKFVRAAGRAVRYYGNKKLEKLGENIQNSHPIKTVGKIGGGVVAATAGGIIGGLSGDPTKAFQYASTGAVAGYAATDKVLPDFSNSAFQGALDIGKEEYYGDKIDEYNMKEYKRKFIKNYDNRIRLESKLGSKEQANIFMKNAASDYIENGVTDIDDMIAAYKLEQDGVVANRNMGIATVKYAKRLGSKPSDMKDKDKKEWHTTFKNELQNNKHIRSQNLDLDKEADKIMDRVNAFYNVKNN